jgi:hypothetical protein
MCRYFVAQTTKHNLKQIEIMKNIGKLVIRVLVVIVLFTSVSVSLSSVGVKAVNEAKAAISYQQAYAYLVNHGYTVITLEPCARGENWIAHTTFDGLHLWSTVHVEGSQIIGITDVPY